MTEYCVSCLFDGRGPIDIQYTYMFRFRETYILLVNLIMIRKILFVYFERASLGNYDHSINCENNKRSIKSF